MDITFERGREDAPKGHAFVYFRSSTDEMEVWASYLVILPITVDVAKYVPPFLMNQIPDASMQDLSAFAFPPAPEQMESFEQLQEIAEMRDDDVLFAGTFNPSDLPSMMMAAGDTFRAAGVSQLELWGGRVGCPVVSRPTGADAAGLAFDALDRARKDGTDVLLVDTAGRLQNRDDLMAELQKIIRVMRQIDPSVPHSCLLVLDATTGQNTHAQVGVFREMTDVTGLILTKLDGTAKGGVLVALAERFGLPVHAIGVGEGEDDLQPFDADAFAQRLMGLAE